MSQNEAERADTSSNTYQADEKHQRETQGTQAAGDTSQNEAEGMKASGESHRMSIGLVIGCTIGAIGVILLLYGLFGGTSYAHSDGININLWWGLLMVAFGIIMAGGNYLTARMHTRAATK
jgi:cation transport ATPase